MGWSRLCSSMQKQSEEMHLPHDEFVHRICTYTQKQSYLVVACAQKTNMNGHIYMQSFTAYISYLPDSKDPAVPWSRKQYRYLLVFCSAGQTLHLCREITTHLHFRSPAKDGLAGTSVPDKIQADTTEVDSSPMSTQEPSNSWDMGHPSFMGNLTRSEWRWLKQNWKNKTYGGNSLRT